MRYTTINSPIGKLMLAGDEHGLRLLSMPPFRVEPAWQRDDIAFADVRTQLTGYFAGKRREFDVQLNLVGNPFELSVWEALCTIPYGETASYGDIARAVARPNAVRAVGQANGRNPLAIVVPCHRVIGADGRLTGYAGGIERKRWLLAHERAGVLEQRSLL